MTTRIAINGFGRIGRKVYRLLLDQAEFEVVAINDLADASTLAYLLAHDSVHIARTVEVSLVDQSFEIEGRSGRWKTQVLAVPKPEKLPWKQLGVDIVVECSGRFVTAEAMSAHLTAGAGRVLLSAPAKGDVDATVVCGVNDAVLRPEHRLISAASCTTNCLAPIVKVIDLAFGIESGLMTTIHAYTNDQVLLDGPHKDLRRARAAALNIVPTTTGAATAVALVYPKMAGRLDGMACRVPVPCGSLVDLTCITERDVTPESINAAVAAAAAGPMAGIIEYSTGPLVSQDVIGNSHSSIFDSLVTITQGSRLAKVLAWYDNEWGYSCRVVDVAGRLAALGKA